MSFHVDLGEGTLARPNTWLQEPGLGLRVVPLMAQILHALVSPLLYNYKVGLVLVYEVGLGLGPPREVICLLVAKKMHHGSPA